MTLTSLPPWFASRTASRVPRPTGPATGITMSAPSLMKLAVFVLPLATFSKSPVNEPVFASLSQPRTLTSLSLTSL